MTKTAATPMDFVGVGSGVDASTGMLTGLHAGRRDGRSFTEMRSLSLEQGPLHAADGSASVRVGNSAVLAAVYGPTEAPSNRLDPMRCTVTVTVRDGSTENLGGSESIRDLVQSSMLSALHPRKGVVICVHILSADGGERAAAINATLLALLDAGVPLLNMPISSCVGISNKVVIADPSSAEENEADAVLTLTFSSDDGSLSQDFAAIHSTGDCGGVDEFKRAVSVAHILAEHTLGFIRLSIERKLEQPRAY